MEDVPKRKSALRRPEGFDVTQVIGRVTVGVGEDTPYVVAFRVIAEHGADGDFEFPMANGQACRVTVSYEDDALSQ